MWLYSIESILPANQIRDARHYATPSSLDESPASAAGDVHPSQAGQSALVASVTSHPTH